MNDHLGHVEAVGLLRRVSRIDPATKRQLPTRYILGFEPGFTPTGSLPCPKSGHGFDAGAECPPGAEDLALGGSFDAEPCPDFGHGIDAKAVSDFQPEPCPENAESRVRKMPKAVSGKCRKPCPENAESRVRISDTNLVREPLSKPVKEEEDAQARDSDFDQFFGNLLTALGLDPNALPGWWQGLPPRQHVRRWRDQLRLTEAEILAAGEASRQEHPEPPDGPKALDRAMQRAAQRKAECAGRKRKPTKASTDGGAPAAVSITDLPAFYADVVNSDRFLPVSAVSNTMRDAMLARGLVSVDRLRERGIR